MKQTEFDELIKNVSKDLEALRKKPYQGFKFPKIDKSYLDMGQSLVWVKVANAEFDYLEDDWEHCEGCIDVLKGSLAYVIEFIRDYLDGKFTNPREVATITYVKPDKSESFGVMADLNGGYPRVVSRNSWSADLHIFFESQKSKYKSVDDIIFPEKLQDYLIVPGTRSKLAIFQQELPINQ